MIWFALATLMLACAGLVFYQIITPFWLSQFQRKSADFIETPNGAAALMLVAIAETRGPITILERSIIERQLTSILSLHAEATANLVDRAIDTVNVESTPASVLDEVAHILKHKSVSVERQQYITMVQRVARAHDGPTADQQAEIDKLVSRLKIIH
ncbi:hypothetical protein N9O95_04740 [Alphaproteobacteria bacterium]|nr:hypothetical protein [Alphaproteobacteria bacterium]